MAEFKLDLSELFRKTGEAFVKEFQKKVAQRQNFDGSGTYSPLKNKRPKGHRQGLNTRLNDTGELKRLAFDSVMIDNNSVRVFVTDAYADIVRYNNMASPTHNKNINPPGSYVFPIRGQEADIMKMQSYRDFQKNLQQAMNIQAGLISAALVGPAKPVTIEFPFGPKK